MPLLALLMLSASRVSQHSLFSNNMDTRKPKLSTKRSQIPIIRPRWGRLNRLNYLAVELNKMQKKRQHTTLIHSAVFARF